MFKFESLDALKHQQLRVMPCQLMDRKNQVHLIDIFPAEIALLAQELPLFFNKDSETGQFNLITLMGLTIDENLLIENSQWCGRYLPLKFQAQPFYLLPAELEQSSPQENKQDSTLMNIVIDRADDRVQELSGEKLFNDGVPSEYLKNRIKILKQITEGYTELDSLTAFYLENELIEPLTLDITLNNKQKLSITGLYTIHRALLTEKIEQQDKSMPDSVFQQTQLNSLANQTRAYLNMAKHILDSQVHVKRLIELKNKLCEVS
ncbi:SapC family protein [Thalassotalea profundi]|uniref:SapC family protein n=1 Tax=Thalassotalea profundi TaxID=2036687 RepID=A0ABQ3IML7_9GAMM|nr:SapC family protein [Thalassotalea profundi]GHE86936.1 hypothetical protein GCM10011501_15240 [Thalassotalea profundi]